MLNWWWNDNHIYNGIGYLENSKSISVLENISVINIRHFILNISFPEMQEQHFVLGFINKEVWVCCRVSHVRESIRAVWLVLINLHLGHAHTVLNCAENISYNNICVWKNRRKVPCYVWFCLLNRLHNFKIPRAEAREVEIWERCRYCRLQSGIFNWWSIRNQVVDRILPETPAREAVWHRMEGPILQRSGRVIVWDVFRLDLEAFDFANNTSFRYDVGVDLLINGN